MFKNALVSVSNKTGLIEFLRPLVQSGLRVVSTGGTSEHLIKNGIPVIDIAEQTGFPEVMGGRVKTLHPHVHMPILCRRDHPEDFELLKSRGLEPFDLVICNLYPFEEAVMAQLQGPALVEKIDIGGPTVLRASAKNHDQVTVICDPIDYAWVAEKALLASEMTLEERRKLAAKVFSHCAAYDSLVAKELGAGWGVEFSLGGHKVMDLRYGENPQQQASWYSLMANQQGLHSSEILQGKALSYNNILDLDAASNLLQILTDQFRGTSASAIAVAVKHNNPCGAAVATTGLLALEKTLSADPVSVFGGIIAINQKMGTKEAELLHTLFLECIVAPDYSAEAMEIFSKKKNLRILKWKEISKKSLQMEMKTVNGGFLLQTKDEVRKDSAHWTFHGDHPSDPVLRDLYFGERVCASLKSNAIALVKSGQTLGLGMGQVNRVDAVKQAIDRMQAHFGNPGELILVSDAFFPFADSVEIAARAGVRWILQPGGSVKDQEVLAAAKRLKMNMILSADRHFKH